MSLIRWFGALILAGAACSATPITLANGDIYNLTYSLISGSTYKVTYTLDTTNYTGPGSFISAVSLKISNSISTFSLISAPGPGTWSVQAGQSNSGGCSGSGAGWICSQYNAANNIFGAAIGGVNTWVFSETIGGSLFTGQDASSIKALFVDNKGAFAGYQVSVPTTIGTSLPEPSAFLLLGAGLTAMSAFIVRRRRRAC